MLHYAYGILPHVSPMVHTDNKEYIYIIHNIAFPYIYDVFLCYSLNIIILYALRNKGSFDAFKEPLGFFG